MNRDDPFDDPNAETPLVAVSLKMYFGPGRTLTWCHAVAAIARRHEAVVSNRVQLVVLPSTPVVSDTVDVFDETGVFVGGQDLFYEDRGPYTGGVSGADLRWYGCRFVEVGHTERRRIFGEDDHVVARKVDAAWRNRLIPILCVGEDVGLSDADAADVCVAQAHRALARPRVSTGPLVVAYEPTWAIGRRHPAPAERIAAVSDALRTALTGRRDITGVRIIYGGGAGPGLLNKLGDSVDGLFLGRSAHDPEVVSSVLDEAIASARGTAPHARKGGR